MKESKATEEDVALKEMTLSTTREAQELARASTLEKQEHLCELSRALAVLASASVSIGMLLSFSGQVSISLHHSFGDLLCSFSILYSTILAVSKQGA